MLKSTPLEKLHRENGARFGEDQGWALPLHFGNVLDEYRAARSGVALVDRCKQSVLRFTGTDRVSFLQGMVSNDVAMLSPGRGIPAAFPDIQGKVIADVKILSAEDSFFAELDLTLKDKVLGHLGRYLIADDVEITDQTDDYGILALYGPKAAPLLGAWLKASDLPAGQLDHREFRVDSRRLRVIRVTRPAPGYEIWGSATDFVAWVQSVQEEGRGFSARWAGVQAQEILRVEAGVPRYGIDMDEENLLLETGMDDAVSYDKGCYLGQEVIERIHSRGHVNRKLSGLVLESDEPAGRGDRVHAGEKEVGRVTSSVFSPVLHRAIALGYLQREFYAPGTHLAVRGAAGLVSCIVTPLPFQG